MTYNQLVRDRTRCQPRPGSTQLQSAYGAHTQSAEQWLWCETWCSDEPKNARRLPIKGVHDTCFIGFAFAFGGGLSVCHAFRHSHTQICHYVPRAVQQSTHQGQQTDIAKRSIPEWIALDEEVRKFCLLLVYSSASSVFDGCY